MSLKPFKTYEEQIEVLKSRNLIFNDEEKAKYFLSSYNYYNIVNGYKKPFLKKDLNGNIIEPEQFCENCTFDELLNLYYLDKELKSTIFIYLLEFERKLKTYIAYDFSEKYKGETFSYLNIKNFSSKKEDLKDILNIISYLSNEINKKRKPESIEHYINNYEDLPLWVLINQITLGNVSFLYNALDEKLQNKISKSFSFEYKKQYSVKESITPLILKEIIKIAVFFRNICAHDNILLLFKMKTKTKIRDIQKLLKKDDNNINYNGENCFDLICVLKLVLDKESYNNLILSLENIFKKYEYKFKVVSLENIIFLGGFNKNNSLKELLK